MVAESTNYIATPPGETIKEIIADRGMTQKELAARLGCSEKHLSRLVNGDVELTQDMALKLEMVLGAPAGFWNKLESLYREDLAKVKAESQMEADKIIAASFPYAEMVNYGWVQKARDASEKVFILRKYFGVAQLTLLDNHMITHIACRRLSVTDKSDLALMAWAQQAKLIADHIDVKPVNIQLLTEYLPEIRVMTRQDPAVFTEKIKKMFADCGIALVFLPHLKGSFLQGATFYSGKKIVVGMTARGRDADKFWFSLFHELGHIILGHLGKAEGTTEEDEKAADQFAMNTLIPEKEMKELESGKIDRITIIDFSSRIGIDAGIIVGRLQNDGILSYRALNDLKKHYVIA